MHFQEQYGNLKEKTVKVEIYLFIPNEDRPWWVSRSYIWGVGGKILSAGMMETPKALIEDIIESYRKREPEYISLQFLQVIPMGLNSRWNRQLKPILECDIEHNFKKALEGYSIIGIADYEE